MKELEAKLAEIKIKIEQNTQDLDAVDTNRTRLFEEKSAIERQIAEEKKPKLRHGDVYINQNGSLIVGKRKGKFFPMREDGVGSTFSTDDDFYHDCRPVFNAFDELKERKAMQEDVTEFSIKGKHFGRMSVRIGNIDGIAMERDDDKINIPSGELSNFILKLRQMQATMKRKNQKGVL